MKFATQISPLLNLELPIESIVGFVQKMLLGNLLLNYNRKVILIDSIFTKLVVTRQ